MRVPAATSPRVRSLTLCVSMALIGQEAALGASPFAGYRAEAEAMAVLDSPIHVTAQNRVVKNCNDSGPDSLRNVITNQAQPGDTVDLSELPVRCGMTSSVITLGSEIVVAQDDLTMYGPSVGAVTVSGGGMSRIFHHTGAGTLSLNRMTVTDGYYRAMGGAYGGCIDSDAGNVFLNRVTVSQCTVASEADYGNGGGVGATNGNITLIASQIVGNQAKSGPTKGGWGGGVYSRGSTASLYSTISGNTAHDDPSYPARGGGIAAEGGLTLVGTTINNNTAGYGGGIRVWKGATLILNSTISHNTASRQAGGALWTHADSAVVGNSTIAFNQSTDPNGEGGLDFSGSTMNSALTLQSSIIANNTSGVATPSDVYLNPGWGALGGADNLVIAANVFNPLVITVMTDPKLGPLQSNGGRTQTHMLLPGSPALSRGNVNALSPPWDTTDQRGNGYPRTTGSNTIVDLGAVQFDAIFVDGFDAFY